MNQPKTDCYWWSDTSKTCIVNNKEGCAGCERYRCCRVPGSTAPREEER